MSNFGDHPTGFFGDSSFYNGVATQSARFDLSNSAYLTRTPDSAGNQALWTASMWIKRTGLTNDYFFGTQDGGSNIGSFSFTAAGKLIVNNKTGSTGCVLNTDMQFRDTSAWYHLVVVYKGDESAAANRTKVYVNGSQVATTVTEAGGTGNGFFNAATATGVGRVGSYTSNFLDGYLADVNLVDGLGLDPSYFGQTKGGVWIAKEPVVSDYGTNGFRLQFAQVGVGTASTTTIGADTSGETNHFTSSGIVASDCNMPDSPENNFCTLNPLELIENNSGAATSKGNLKWSNVNALIDSTFGFGNSGGKYYWEYLYVSSTDGNHYQGVTLQKDGISITNAFSTGIALYFNDGTTRVDGTSGTGFGAQIGADNIIQFKLDLDNGTLQFGKNNTYITALTLPTSIGGWRAGGIQAAGSGGTRVFVVNYGQDSSFAGTKTAQGNTDENGLGDFFYAVPSGFLAVCSANLPEPTIGPNSGETSADYFNVVGYTGNGGALSVTGFDHQPDLLWIKSRSITGNHRLTDSSRGVSFNWITNADDAEKGDSDSEDIDSFDTDGFTVTQSEYDDFNDGSDTYLAFSWKANGGTDTATGSENGNNPGYNQQANSKAGFSIIKYVGTQAVGTIPHGLGKKPDWMIFKNREVNGNAPIVYHSANTAAPATDHLALNSGALSADNANRFNDTQPTSSVFTLGADGNINDNGVACIAYIWTAIDGFSKFGGYTGNSAANGTFIYLGFRPAWVMYKASAGVGNNWHINYPKLVDNENNKYVLGNGDGAENSANAIDFLSNGFKFRHSSQAGNNSSGAYIYMAFAEAPFKYSNAR